jgi:DNA-binding MarR family transcriptional regulator
MRHRLLTELKMTGPFASLAHEAHLNLARTEAVLGHAVEEALRPHGITITQFNVLRILRGAGTEGLCRSAIGERMIRRVPDVTRLLDRLEEARLVTRERTGDDRRYVTTRITAAGLALLRKLDSRVNALHEDLLGHLGPERLRTLITLLEDARQRP